MHDRRRIPVCSFLYSFLHFPSRQASQVALNDISPFAEAILNFPVIGRMILR
jgi:hypothetical protein